MLENLISQNTRGYATNSEKLRSRMQNLIKVHWELFTILITFNRNMRHVVETIVFMEIRANNSHIVFFIYQRIDILLFLYYFNLSHEKNDFVLYLKM